PARLREHRCARARATSRLREPRHAQAPRVPSSARPRTRPRARHRRVPCASASAPEYLARARVVAIALRLAVEAAVDLARDFVEARRAGVGEGVEPARLPVPARHAKAHVRVTRASRVAFEVEPERRPREPVVGPPGQLDRAAPLVPLAVPRLRVAEILAPLVSIAAREFLEVPPLGRLKYELRDERRH